VAHRRFSLYCQNQERLVMQHVMDYVDREGSVGVLVHDGILAQVPGGAERILDDLSEHIRTVTGFSLLFVVKSLEPKETLDELIHHLKGESTGIEIPEYDPKRNQDARFADTFFALHKTKLLFNTRPGKVRTANSSAGSQSQVAAHSCAGRVY
jgi:hypothetical protein